MVIEKDGVKVETTRPVPAHWTPPRRVDVDERKAEQAIRSVCGGKVTRTRDDYKRPGGRA